MEIGTDIDEKELINSYSSSFHLSMDSDDGYNQQFSKRFYYIESTDETTALLNPKMRKRNETVNSIYSKNQLVNSVFNATKSFSKLTISNYMGLSSAAYASACYKEQTTTISLADIPSKDRNAPTSVVILSVLAMITGISTFTFPLLAAKIGFHFITLLILSALLTWYTTYLINVCQYQVSKTGAEKRVYENFIDLGKATIKWKGDLIMKILVGSSVFTDIYYLIFCGQVAKDLFDQQIEIDARIWMVLCVFLVFPLFFIRRMSILAWLGLIAIFLFVIAMAFVIILLIVNYESWKLSNLMSPFDITYCLIGFGAILNSYNCHISVPAFEASMINPKKFPASSVFIFVSNTILKIMLGLVGAASYGLLTKGSILSNLANFGYKATIINVLIALNVFAQYPGSMFVVFEMLDIHVLPMFQLFEKGKRSEYIWLFLSRLFLCILITFVAVSIPNFEMVVSFIGNIRGTITMIVLPVYFYLQIKKKTISLASKIFHWFIIVISTLIGLAGAGLTCYKMIESS